MVIVLYTFSTSTPHITYFSPSYTPPVKDSCTQFFYMSNIANSTSLMSTIDVASLFLTSAMPSILAIDDNQLA